MPVVKLRSLEDAERSLWLDRDDPALWPTVAALWRLSNRLHPRHYPPGVYKHRSMEELNAMSEDWELAQKSG